MAGINSSADKTPAGPEISAIVVVPDKYDELQCTLQHLKNQTAAHLVEIVFVVKTRQQLPEDMSDLACFHSVCVVEVDKIKSIGQGFTEGIKRAHAPVVALTEDHSFPDRQWAEVFIEKHKGNCAVVGPCMQNANPVNTLSLADFYQAYGEWTPPPLTLAPSHLPGHNSSYKREVLLSFGEELEYLMHAESVMHRILVAQGHKILLAPETCTSHHNFATWRDWIPSRYHTGRLYAAVWSRKWSRSRRYLFACASPLIPFIRLWRVGKTIRRNERLINGARLMLPLFLGLSVEGLGQMRGYASGAGDSAEKLAKFEFHRIRK